MPPEATDHTNHLPRRTLITAAAWTAPVIAASVGTPAFAASPNCENGTRTVTPTAGNPVLVIPGCVRTITFDIIGSGGASAGDSTTLRQGARMRGTITFPRITGTRTINLIAATGGGFKADGTSTDNGGAGAPGGVGFGNGGRGGTSTGGSWGGGAGSAIVIGGVPYVVAGGGGTSFNSTSGVTVNTVLTTNTQNVVIGTSSGSPLATAHGYGISVAATATSTVTRFIPAPGRGANAAAGGAAGSGSYIASGFTGTVRTGTAGNNYPGGAVGGNGGNAVSIADFNSGAGGGGYAGGGAGAQITSTNPVGTWSASGGAGSSYAGGPGVTLTSGPVPAGLNRAANSVGHAGSVTITW